MDLKHTQLHALHVEAHAKMVNFAGYEVPMWFDRIQKEHDAVRQKVGMFDVSHMGLLLFSGKNVRSFVQKFCTNRLGEKQTYAMVLNEKGGVLDDVMVTPFKQDSVLMVVNASNKGKLLAWFRSFDHDGIHIEDMNQDYSFVAVQGPWSFRVLDQLFDQFVHDLGRMMLVERLYGDYKVWVSRGGYTGEDGFELILPHQCAASFWKDCLGLGVIACGLGARDTLRLEKGFPLYGHELSESITPASQ
jgi:aminomethyltransferase